MREITFDTVTRDSYESTPDQINHLEHQLDAFYLTPLTWSNCSDNGICNARGLRTLCHRDNT